MSHCIAGEGSRMLGQQDPEMVQVCLRDVGGAAVFPAFNENERNDRGRVQASQSTVGGGTIFGV